MVVELRRIGKLGQGVVQRYSVSHDSHRMRKKGCAKQSECVKSVSKGLQDKVGTQAGDAQTEANFEF
jgi:hypothetical protein